MKILIGADLVPTASNTRLFASGNALALVGEKLMALLESADYRIFNLETPITNIVTPIQKCGPYFLADTNTINGIKSIGTDFLTLANNHIYDQGEQGLYSTLHVLDDAGIAYAGVGKNLEEAGRPFIARIGSKRVGIYCCTEHEFSIASENSPGANPYDPLESFDAVRELNKNCDFLVVLYHGGKEYFRYPSPEVRRMAHKFVDCGADLLLCQHTHCIGCEEEYLGKTIVYGQGNFLFDHSSKDEWQTSLLVECDVNGSDVKVAYYPLRKNGNAVRLAEGDDATKIMSDFQQRSNELLDVVAWKKRYREFAERSYQQLFSRVSGCNSHTLISRIRSRLTGDAYVIKKLKRIYDQKALLVLRNSVESESWRELLLEAIQSQNK